MAHLGFGFGKNTTHRMKPGLFWRDSQGGVDEWRQKSLGIGVSLLESPVLESPVTPLTTLKARQLGKDGIYVFDIMIGTSKSFGIACPQQGRKRHRLQAMEQKWQEASAECQRCGVNQSGRILQQKRAREDDFQQFCNYPVILKELWTELGEEEFSSTKEAKEPQSL